MAPLYWEKIDAIDWNCSTEMTLMVFILVPVSNMTGTTEAELLKPFQ